MAPGLPFLGNSVELMGDPLGFFLKSYMTLGPVFRAGGPGREYTVLAGPEANVFLLRGGERYFDHRPLYANVAAELRSENYPIATAGERHGHLRRTLRSVLSPAPLEPWIPRIFADVARAAGALAPGSRQRVLALFHALIGEEIGQVTLGRPLGAALGDAIRFARFSIGAGLGAYPSFARYAPLYLRSKHRMLALMRELVAEHRERPSGRDRAPDLLDALLSATDHEGVPLSDADIIASAQMAYSNNLLYTAPACSFLLYGLLRHPAVLARVLAELEGAAAHGPPTLAALRALPTLRGAVMESMRMYPIGLATPRVVAEPFEFDGHRLEVGSRVLIALAVCHYLPQVYPEPYRFDPDRYQGPRDGHRQPGMFVPFGMGEHACLGARLVEAVMSTLVGALLHQVSLRLDPEAYTLRKVVNPFPEPEGRFAVRVLGQRRGVAPGEDQR